MPKKLTQQDFISRSNATHNSIYDYSQAEYVSQYLKVKIACPVHGSFEQTAKNHMDGQGCPKCGYAKQTKSRSMTFDEFINRSNEVHEHKYDYSEVVWVSAQKRVAIVCPEHGKFTQLAVNHTRGSGCKKCATRVMIAKTRSTKEAFVEKARKVHGDKYGYSKTDYTGVMVQVVINCPAHGDFAQIPNDHLSKKAGCPSCAGVKRLCTEKFVEKAKKVHGDRYTYTNANYHLTDTKINITCLKHGDFLQTPHDHVSSKAGCPSCGCNGISKGETELTAFIRTLGFQVETRNRKIIAPKELDIVIPEKNLAIEYNGLYFHSDAFPDARSKHKQKSDQCQAAGYKLIHIYEDDWLTRTDVVKKTLKHILGVSDEKLYARKLTTQVLPAKATKPFYAANHMQGFGRGDSWCLIDNNRIVAAMQFGISSSERGNKDASRYELIRFATSCQVVGGASKLFKAFLKDNPDVQTIVSYSDNDMFTGKMYEVLGFVNAGQTSPDYKVIVGQQRVHKANFKKSQIKKNYPDAYSEELTEKEMCKLLGYFRIYNTGLTKWVWSKEPILRLTTSIFPDTPLV